jgi:formate hydrogenlyase subunit 4
VYSRTTGWIFRLAPVALLATTVTAATLVPLDGRESLLRFAGDAVAFAGLLALGRFLLVLGAMDTGSSFEGMGASREVTFAALIEPGLFVTLAVLGVASRDTSLSGMLGGAAARSEFIAPLIMVAASLFALTLAECSRVPVDDPATHLELTMVHEVMVLDHSGPDLAMILYAGSLKLAVFAALMLDVVLPAPRPPEWLGLMGFVVALLGLGIAIGVVESLVARLRLPKVPLYLAAGSALGLFGLILLLR